MEEKNPELLSSIIKLLMRNGIKSMTMDDISRGLGMSKKTLYKHFKDKNELVKESLENYLKEYQDSMESIQSSGLNAVDEIFGIMKFVAEKIKDFHPSIHYDLEKYHPEAHKLFLDFKNGFIYSSVATNLEKGIKEGFFRDNINIPIVARLHVARIDSIFDSQLFPPTEFSFVDVLVEMMRYHIRGIANERGINYLVTKYKNKNIL